VAYVDCVGFAAVAGATDNSAEEVTQRPAEGT